MFSDSRIANVDEYVRAHLGEPIPLEIAASVAGLSEKYFSTLFRQTVGIGFHEWLVRLRVDAAAALIEEGDQTLTQIAFEVGFQDMRTFERNFKRLRALTPRAYRRAARSESEI